MAYLQNVPGSIQVGNTYYKFTPKAKTRAIQRYARKHNMYADFVRTNTLAYREALTEYVTQVLSYPTLATKVEVR